MIGILRGSSSEAADGSDGKYSAATTAIAPGIQRLVGAGGWIAAGQSWDRFVVLMAGSGVGRGGDEPLLDIGAAIDEGVILAVGIE